MSRVTCKWFGCYGIARLLSGLQGMKIGSGKVEGRVERKCGGVRKRKLRPPHAEAADGALCEGKGVRVEDFEDK
jgi:hypothetical protein